MALSSDFSLFTTHLRQVHLRSTCKSTSSAQASILTHNKRDEAILEKSCFQAVAREDLLFIDHVFSALLYRENANLGNFLTVGPFLILFPTQTKRIQLHTIAAYQKHWSCAIWGSQWVRKRFMSSRIRPQYFELAIRRRAVCL